MAKFLRWLRRLVERIEHDESALDHLSHQDFYRQALNDHVKAYGEQSSKER